MRIAVSTTDGSTICGHMGKCRTFIVYEVEGGEITGRDKIMVGGTCPGHDHDHGHDHGHGGGVHNVSFLSGCEAVITQGMGQGLHSGLVQAGIRPVITQLTDPETAVRQYASGEIQVAAAPSCSCGKH